jgi:epoxyqueuosine reductase
MVNLSKKELKEYALTTAGADLIGIANIERFDGCPAEFHPHRLNNRTRSVIVIGLRILRGAIRGLEQGTGRIAYNAYGYGGINRNYMPDVMHKLAGFIEDKGFEAVPTIQWTGMPPLEPIIDHRIAAVAAGLGEIGHSKILLTKEFGPLQRIGIILTDAVIEPDELQKPSICDGCMACVKDCPVDAINNKETESVVIEGVEFRWGKLDVFLCGIAHCGAHERTTPFMPDEDFDVSEEMKTAHKKLKNARSDIERRAVAEETAVAIKKKYAHPIHLITFNLGGSRAMCGARGCVRSCLAHLDRTGKICNQFDRPFRAKGSKPKPMDTFSSASSNARCQFSDDDENS